MCESGRNRWIERRNVEIGGMRDGESRRSNTIGLDLNAPRLSFPHISFDLHSFNGTNTPLAHSHNTKRRGHVHMCLHTHTHIHTGTISMV